MNNNNLHFPSNPVFRKTLRKAFADNRRCCMPPLPFSAAAFLTAELHSELQQAVVVITDSLLKLEEFQRHIEVFMPTTNILRLPADDPDYQNGTSGTGTSGTGAGGERAQVFFRLPNINSPLIVTCVQAMMQTIVPHSRLMDETLHLCPGSIHEPGTLLQHLQTQGYEITIEVESPGQAAQRGGLLDVWSPGLEWPCRLEFFGDTIETMRWFNPLTQRSHAPADELVILPALEAGGMAERREIPVAQMPADAVYVWFEPAFDYGMTAPGGISGIAEHAEIMLKSATHETATGQLVTLTEVQAAIAERKDTSEFFVSSLQPPNAKRLELGFRHLPAPFIGRENSLTPDVFEAQRRQWLNNMARTAREGRRVILFFGTPGTLQRFRELYPDIPFELREGMLTDGFENDLLNLTIVADSNLAGQRKQVRGSGMRIARPEVGETVTDALQIEPGDLVVHIEHGIGRYLGLQEIVFNGKSQEVLAVEYAEKAKLYVPVAHAHLLSRYIGAGRRYTVTLHRLGGKRWNREKNAAENAVRDLAAGLLETQALRNTREGFVFPADTPWQHEFEAGFPHYETNDQERAIREVKQDMQAPQPMDRLICGDAGYGKTEVAMRGAFKCVMAGRQAAVLVPTTVLAQQHFECFRERMRDYPIRIELLCRFQSAATCVRIAQDLADGTVDIVIGTHRLLQPDVKFKDLGLVIIDEEQRFGVEHKERLKQMKQMVDVLTMTATPIPRTLYLSLTGAREISLIQTPPRERREIETIVTNYDETLIRNAILRELNRGGQVFYLYNRVMTITRMAERLRRLVPEARIAIGHGQMAAGELSDVVHGFAQGNCDILLCTTIIESGLDIPNANTILIDRADRFGMADLYQLRGRVGRSTRKAYAYLLLPPYSRPMDDARRRLGAIAEYSGAGAGFRLALRDLEIRGAGNLLGAAQSGHIAAIGFELYCRLLRHAVTRLNGDEPLPLSPPRLTGTELNLDFIEFSTLAATDDNGAFLPADYIEDEKLRLQFFRRLALADTPAALGELNLELTDRFGALPAPAKRLLKMAELRARAASAGITSIAVRDDRVILRRNDEYLQNKHRFPRLKSRQADSRLDELLEILKNYFIAFEKQSGKL